MPITPNADLCGTCHKTTTDEWRASVHGQQGIQCEACHDPHSQNPKADSVTALCTGCHQERGNSFTHSTHANAGLECSNCHMYTSPRTNDPIQGLVPTGHTFSVGSDACIACHQDTVHTRDQIVKLTGEVAQLQTVDAATLEQQVQSQQQQISDLKTQSTNRLYIGLAQGAIVGLLTGGAAAWVVSRGIRVVEVKEDE
jgi:predicted CXXCH cytochrome family protein